MTVNLNLEKDSKTFSVTAFPKAVSAFFYEDIFPSMTTMTLASWSYFSWKMSTFNFPRMGNLL